MKRLLAVLICLLSITFISCEKKEVKIPKLTITCNGRELEVENAGYHWSKNGESIIADAASPEEIAKDMNGNKVEADENLELKFSQETKSITVVSGEELKNIEYEVIDNKIKVPSEGENYILLIEGKWEEGYVNYVTKIRVYEKGRTEG